MMGFEKILQALSKKEFSTVLTDIQALLVSEDEADCSEVCKLLRALYQAIVPSSIDLETESTKTLIFQMIPCINLCIDHLQNKFSCADLIKNQFFPVLYHLIRTFLKCELYHPAISNGNILKILLKDNEFGEKSTYIKNMSVMFWNEALHIEKNSEILDFDIALKLRLSAIEYLLLDKNIDNVIEKINIALVQYCNKNDKIVSENLQNVLQDMWLYLENFDNSYNYKVILYKTLQTWYDIFLKYYNDNSIIKLILARLQDLSKTCKKKEQKFLSICCNLSKLSLQFFIFQESDSKLQKICSNYEEYYKNSKELLEIDYKMLASTSGFIYSSFIKCFRSMRSSECETVSAFLQDNLSSCVTLTSCLFDLFSEESVKKYLTQSPSSKYTTCCSITNFFTTLIKNEQSDIKKKQFINEAERFLKFACSKIKVKLESDDESKSIISFGSCITRLALVLYGFSLYPESTYFFEVADNIFSMCSSFSGYHTDETQLTMWKLHEVSVHVYFLTGYHEKALQLIVKSLVLHTSKTKECFDLWRRVKKDAVRNGVKSVVPKIVSDYLSMIKFDISVEKELEYLVEELKVCKSDRSNLNEEIIILSQKILSMPCSDSVRAYIFLEILTAPSNVSDKISSLLNKSLSEICKETISLYVNHLAKNPEDCGSKICLSIAYFWLYHDYIKNVHEIAAKEAQNILKPQTPKPETEVQNDTEEENDTCDIQPVHPLVSISVENETFKFLNLAVELWDELSEDQWTNISHVIKEKNVLDIIQAVAEIFCTAVQDTKELKLWLLLRTVSICTNSESYEQIANISLVNFFIRLGYLNMASYFMSKVENKVFNYNEVENKNSSINEHENIKIKYKLSKSVYFLHIGKFDQGLQLIRDILSSSVIGKKFKSVKMLHAETLLVLSNYLVLPTKAFSETDNVQYLKMKSALAVSMESLSICKALLKHISETLFNEFDLICFKPVLIKNLIKAHLQLGELYFKVGEPRISRCFLQEVLKLAESHILSYWSSKILLILSHIDFVCDSFKDCRVKASGLKYVMDRDARPLEVLNHLQAKYSNPVIENPFSPDSPDGLIISSVPDIAFQRHMKQTFIDKIDVMSSPLSKRNKKSNYKNKFNCFIDEENFFVNLLQLESCMLSYLLLETEQCENKSDEMLCELLNSYSSLKDFKCLHNIVKSIKVDNDVKKPYLRVNSDLEVIFYVFVQLKKLESYCIKNDIISAKETLKKSFEFLEKTVSAPSFSYPDIYASLKYQDIRVTLCEFYQIPLASDLVYYFCPSLIPNIHIKKKCYSSNSTSIKTPSTPVSKDVPDIVVTEYKSKVKKCQAPLKRNLLNSNLKKDLASENSLSNSPFVTLNSSDELQTFESPYDSFSRATKTRARIKQNSKENSEFHYQFFTQKNFSKVENSSDIWKNSCLTDTPKLGKENRKLRSCKTLPKSSAVSKKKTNSVSAVKNSTVSTRTRSKKTKSVKSIVASEIKLNKPIDENCAIDSERDMSIEYSRSSPIEKNCEANSIHSNFACDSKNMLLSSDITASDNVFLTPAKNVQKMKIPSIIDDLCKDLSSLSLTQSKVPHVAAGNLDEIITELNELRLLIQNTMPYPLYGNICKLLSILMLVKRDGTWNEENVFFSSFLLSESFSVTLRNVHIGNMTYYKESEYSKERELMLQILKNSDHQSDKKLDSLLQIIPEKWTVVQVSAFHSEEYLSPSETPPCPTKLVITQFQKNSKPIIVCTDCSSDEKFSSSFLSEFGKILEESHLTTLNKDSKSWWTTRSTLDVRMKALVGDMENIWLGCWKGLFLGLPQNEERIEQLQNISSAISKIAPCSNLQLLKILIDSAHYLSRDQICTAVCYLWRCSHSDDVHQKLCKSMRRLSFALSDTDRHPLILILDQSILDLPWECLPILKNMPVTRMPSLSILHAKLAVFESESVLLKGFDTSKTYYVLNPGGDLIYSQQYFENKFESQDNWKGITGKAPNVQDYVSGMKDHEFFIYCGHGSGRKYLEGTSVDKLKLQATSVIMGCSSGKLKRLGRVLEAHGLVLKLLLCGCPSITANLWDVTDKDIDRFTDKMLQCSVPNYDDLQCKKYNLAKAVSVARNACKMRYLVGAAPIVYGFPVFAKEH